MRMSEMLTLAQAAKRCPNRPHTSAIWRWCRNGLQTKGGGRVKLEHRRVGGRIYTSEAALMQFFEALSIGDAAYFDAAAGDGSALEDGHAN